MLDWSTLTVFLVASAALLLSAIFVVMALLSDSMYALLADTAGGWLKQNRQFIRFQKYVAGSIYILLGVTAAFSGSGRAN